MSDIKHEIERLESLLRQADDDARKRLDLVRGMLDDARVSVTEKNGGLLLLVANLLDILDQSLVPDPETPPKTWDGWYWPTPIWHGEIPVISDPFRRHAVGTKGQKGYRRQHLGVDTTFKNAAAMTPSPPDNTKWYHHPDGVPMLAAGPGTLWFAGETATGWTVKIDHHNFSPDGPWVTYYTHMSKLFVPLDDRSAKGVELMGGEEIGIIGDNPRSPDDVRHSHFEIWDYSPGVADGRVNRCLDPARYYDLWKKKSLPQEAHVGLNE